MTEHFPVLCVDCINKLKKKRQWVPLQNKPRESQLENSVTGFELFRRAFTSLISVYFTVFSFLLMCVFELPNVLSTS